ncbi:MAG: hypothetical protein KAQ81_01765 [Deltaproteobacteria bacterium]|nr:hypothetical protein [Deltaproteobacteria bacterium]
MLQKTSSSRGGFLSTFNNRTSLMVYLRPKHIVTGLVFFGCGLYLTFLNILYVVEFLKGLAQPILLVVGLTALTAGIFSAPKSSKSMKMISLVVGVLCVAVGCYGVYDEYYATMDFIRGLLPPLLIVAGLTALIHGITRLR